MNPKDVRIRIIIAELVAVLDRNLRFPRDILAIGCSLLEQIKRSLTQFPQCLIAQDGGAVSNIF